MSRFPRLVSCLRPSCQRIPPTCVPCTSPHPALTQRQEDGHNRLKRVILIGDHHQLPPVVKNMAIQQYRCGPRGWVASQWLVQLAGQRASRQLQPSAATIGLPRSVASSHRAAPVPFQTLPNPAPPTIAPPSLAATWTSRCSRASSGWARPTSSSTPRCAVLHVTAGEAALAVGCGSQGSRRWSGAAAGPQHWRHAMRSQALAPLPTPLPDKPHCLQGRARPTLAKLYNWRYRALGDLPNVQEQPAFRAANPGEVLRYWDRRRGLPANKLSTAPLSLCCPICAAHPLRPCPLFCQPALPTPLPNPPGPPPPQALRSTSSSSMCPTTRGVASPHRCPTSTRCEQCQRGGRALLGSKGGAAGQANPATRPGPQAKPSGRCRPAGRLPACYDRRLRSRWRQGSSAHKIVPQSCCAEPGRGGVPGQRVPGAEAGSGLLPQRTCTPGKAGVEQQHSSRQCSQPSCRPAYSYHPRPLPMAPFLPAVHAAAGLPRPQDLHPHHLQRPKGAAAGCDRAALRTAPRLWPPCQGGRCSCRLLQAGMAAYSCSNTSSTLAAYLA